MGERFAHYSAEPFSGPVRSTPLAEQTIHSKPKGFWISVEGNDDGWREWCEGEEFNLEGLAHRTDIELAPNANILWLRDAWKIDEVTARYEGLPYPTITTYRQIDWRPIAEQYQGIIIAPYHWSRRLCDRSRWYYSWDCASGCIWDAAAIVVARPSPEDRNG